MTVSIGNGAVAPLDPARHRDRRALVTGAGSGIGLATVLRLAREGARVVGCDVRQDGLERAEKALRTAGFDAELVRCDVTDQSDVDDLAAGCGDGAFGLVANVAGVLDDFSPVGEVSDEVWERVLAVNLTGVMRITRAFVPAMVRSGGGVVVNVSSIGGVRGGVAGAAYTASKHGVIGLSRSTAYLYASSGIRCNVVCPGAVDTPLGHGVRPAAPWALEHMLRVMPRIDERTDPEQIAALISWLGSAEAAVVNGAVVTADGGWTAG